MTFQTTRALKCVVLSLHSRHGELLHKRINLANILHAGEDVITTKRS